MAPQKRPNAVEKRTRSKKNKSRTEVSSSSESSSDSEAEQKKSRKAAARSKKDASQKMTNNAKATKSSKAQQDSDTDMNDSPPALPDANSKPEPRPLEDFNTIYLRKVTAELGDDLDKVRSAQDFKTASIPMLIHALKQGESLFSTEEKRRMLAAGDV